MNQNIVEFLKKKETIMKLSIAVLASVAAMYGGSALFGVSAMTVSKDLGEGSAHVVSDVAEGIDTETHMTERAVADGLCIEEIQAASGKDKKANADKSAVCVEQLPNNPGEFDSVADTDIRTDTNFLPEFDFTIFDQASELNGDDIVSYIFANSVKISDENILWANKKTKKDVKNESEAIALCYVACRKRLFELIESGTYTLKNICLYLDKNKYKDTYVKFVFENDINLAEDLFSLKDFESELNEDKEWVKGLKDGDGSYALINELLMYLLSKRSEPITDDFWQLFGGWIKQCDEDVIMKFCVTSQVKEKIKKEVCLRAKGDEGMTDLMLSYINNEMTNLCKNGYMVKKCLGFFDDVGVFECISDRGYKAVVRLILDKLLDSGLEQLRFEYGYDLQLWKYMYLNVKGINTVLEVSSAKDLLFVGEHEGDTFSEKKGLDFLLRCSVQSLKAVKKLHDCGYVHGHINPGTLVGVNNYRGDTRSIWQQCLRDLDAIESIENVDEKYAKLNRIRQNLIANVEKKMLKSGVDAIFEDETKDKKNKIEAIIKILRDLSEKEIREKRIQLAGLVSISKAEFQKDESFKKDMIALGKTFLFLCAGKNYKIPETDKGWNDLGIMIWRSRFSDEEFTPERVLQYLNVIKGMISTDAESICTISDVLIAIQKLKRWPKVDVTSKGVDLREEYSDERIKMQFGKDKLPAENTYDFLLENGFKVIRCWGMDDFGIIWEYEVEDGTHKLIKIFGEKNKMELISLNQLNSEFAMDEEAKEYLDLGLVLNDEKSIVQVTLAKSADMYCFRNAKSLLYKFRQALQALKKLHDKNYSHNDINPLNFLISDDLARKEKEIALKEQLEKLRKISDINGMNIFLVEHGIKERIIDAIKNSKLNESDKLEKIRGVLEVIFENKIQDARLKLTNFRCMTKIEENGVYLNAGNPNFISEADRDFLGKKVTKDQIEKRDIYALGMTFYCLLTQKDVDVCVKELIELHKRGMDPYWVSNFISDIRIQDFTWGLLKQYLDIIIRMTKDNYAERCSISEALEAVNSWGERIGNCPKWLLDEKIESKCLKGKYSLHVKDSGKLLWQLGFNVVKFLGCGGFGVVWECVLENGTHIAIKVLNLGSSVEEIESVRSLNEAVEKNGDEKAKKYLNLGEFVHEYKNIIMLPLAKESWSVSLKRHQLANLTTKLVDPKGTEISKLSVEKKPIVGADKGKTLDTLLRRSEQALKAVKKLHDLGFSHNDIKEGNFLKISDWPGKQAKLNEQRKNLEKLSRMDDIAEMINLLKKHEKSDPRIEQIKGDSTIEIGDKGKKIREIVKEILQKRVHKTRLQLADFGLMSRMSEKKYSVSGTKGYIPLKDVEEGKVAKSDLADLLEKRDVYALGVTFTRLLFCSSREISTRLICECDESTERNDLIEKIFKQGFSGEKTQERLVRYFNVIRKMLDEDHKKRCTILEALCDIREIRGKVSDLEEGETDVKQVKPDEGLAEISSEREKVSASKDVELDVKQVKPDEGLAEISSEELEEEETEKVIGELSLALSEGSAEISSAREKISASKDVELDVKQVKLDEGLSEISLEELEERKRQERF